MNELSQARALLDEINAAISGYDDVLKEKARDILLQQAFGPQRQAAAPAAAEALSTPPAAPARAPGKRNGGRVARRRTRGVTSALLDQWRPASMAERALVGAYVLAGGRAERTVTSQTINAELKRHSLPVPNITRAIESNLRARPPLMVQKKKLGTTRQARKQYALTQAGVEHVEARLAAEAGHDAAE